jgi:uncharacterized protein YndB with AHSA1/START domain
MDIRMKKKFELEYYIKTPPKVLFPRLSTPGGLSEWFADNVTIKGQHEYSFHWDNTIQKAEQTHIRENQCVKYEWKDISEPSYFEFRLKTDELTGDLALMITDFAEEDEKEDAIELWDTQIAKLKHTLGI